MNSDSLLEKLFHTFDKPKKFRFISWAITLLAIIVGITISLFLRDWLWLARTGAVIVIISLSLEASGFIDRYIDKVIKITAEMAPEIVYMQISNRPHMYGLNGSETKEQLDELTTKEAKRRIRDLRYNCEKIATKYIHRIIFAIATLGTLLWGFADLLELALPLRTQ